jgi:protein TonB
MLSKFRLPIKMVPYIHPKIAHLLRHEPMELLGHRHFAATLLAALLVHFMVLYLWALAPKTQVIDVPVRALSVKLGGDPVFSEDEMKLNPPDAGNNKAVENTIARLIRDPEQEEARAKAVADKMEKAMTPAPKTMPKKLFDTQPARQFVRTTPVAPGTPKVERSNEGASDKNSKELLSRYEQLISLWIQKFKQYPDEARRQGMRGETLVRIRIDRKGNIRYWALEHSTGFTVLDRAAIDMVRRANPVPAVPNDYPAGDQFDFLIPVNFKLE